MTATQTQQPITLRFATIDGVRQTSRFKTLAGAQKKAQGWVGANADIGATYAVSTDGVVRVTCDGCTLGELFGKATKTGPVPGERFFILADYEGGHWPGVYATREEAAKALAEIETYADAGICEYMYDEHGGVVEAPRATALLPVGYDEIPF